MDRDSWVKQDPTGPSGEPQFEISPGLTQALACHEPQTEEDPQAMWDPQPAWALREVMLGWAPTPHTLGTHSNLRHQPPHCPREALPMSHSVRVADRGTSPLVAFPLASPRHSLHLPPPAARR